MLIFSENEDMDSQRERKIEEDTDRTSFKLSKRYLFAVGLLADKRAFTHRR